MTKSAWFCPTCQKHHAPHVDTCPGPVDAVSDKSITRIYPLKEHPIAPYVPNPTSTPSVPFFPTVTCGGSRYPVDPLTPIMNGLIQ